MNRKNIRLICTILLALVVGTANAQRIGCVHFGDQSDMVQGDGPRQIIKHRSLPNPMEFNPEVTYRQLVVLVTFNDTDFSMDDPATYYNRLFNEQGFNEGMGRGCVADYFREQSEGRLNLQFDVYGPVKVNNTAGGHDKWDYGGQDCRAAMKILFENEDIDYSVYDWNGDGDVEQVVFVLAGLNGSQVNGYIWPNTSTFSVKTPGGKYIDTYSASNELWQEGGSCGIGTIIHEFCHCLGLPDIYPVYTASIYSVVDEWDLMDGGNMTNKGWCPPNLSTMEKLYLGWASPVELTEPVTIEGMKPVSDGGETYIIRNSGNSDEFYLLENRRQEGWDYGCPGNGLLIFHVDYSQSAWAGNQVNASNTYFRYDLFHADGKDYRDWDPANNGKDKSKWTMDVWLRSRYLSTSPYPYNNPETFVVNESLTDESDPVAALFTANAQGQNVMGKPVTNIRIAKDGTVGFDFMNPKSDGVTTTLNDKEKINQWYTTTGLRLSTRPTAKGLYIHNGKKVVVR